EGIAFGAPDGNPTYLFFLLGLKYDRLHLPILGRLARALRNPATIAKLRAQSSPDQVRAQLLKEDAAARAGQVPELAAATPFKPKLDRQLRLRAIRRLQTIKKAESAPPAAPSGRSGRAGRPARGAAAGKPARAGAAGAVVARPADPTARPAPRAGATKKKK